MNKVTVDEYILNSGKWEESMILLREIVLSTGLEETVKWNMPVYMLDGKNVLGITAFRSYAGIWFYQGVYLKDERKVLVAEEQSNGAMRKWKFQSIEVIRDEVESIVEYIKEAIKNQEEGKVMKPNLNRPIIVPEELKNALINDPALKSSYDALSKSKRRDFGNYIEQAKLPETRERRLKRVIAFIREGAS